ncbi:MAG: hypothetical protein NVSMB39_5450 [Candidatus Saccharimonadales bacterium]
MIRFLRHYAVPASLLFVSFIGVWGAWNILKLHVVYADFPVGTVLAVLAGTDSVFMFTLSAFLLAKRRAFLTISPYAILAAYLSVPGALLAAAACIAFLIIRSSVNSLTF